jgi:hypothetical protein
MADQIVLAWTVDVAGSSFGPAAAAVALGAAQLYTDPATDPILGQMFGLSVASDASAAGPGPTEATRTLTLNMTSVPGIPFAPPPFPCHPRLSTPPVLPYPLRTAKTLPGSFFVETGSLTVATTATQIPSLSIGDSIQFLSQEGVFYTVAAPITSTSIGLTAAYTGTSANTGAFKEIAAPVALDRVMVFSTSDLDTNGVATVPPIPAGQGAQTIELVYNDSTGAGPFGLVAALTGKRPAAFTPVGPAGIDVSEIVQLAIVTSGGFGNSIGEITLVGLSSALPALPSNLTPGTGIGAAETTVGKVGAPVPRTFKTMTDDAQLLIDRHLAYLPPSYFALAQQGASTPQLAGNFSLTTGETSVPTTEDQTAALAAGNIIRFAEQLWVPYTIATVSPKIIRRDWQHQDARRPRVQAQQEMVGLLSGRAVAGRAANQWSALGAAWAIRRARDCGTPVEPTVEPTHGSGAGIPQRVLHPDVAARACWGAGRAAADRLPMKRRCE